MVFGHLLITKKQNRKSARLQLQPVQPHEHGLLESLCATHRIMLKTQHIHLDPEQVKLVYFWSQKTNNFKIDMKKLFNPEEKPL